MPAIHLPRLRRQASELAEKFSQPKDFVLALKDLLEFYSDRTRRVSRFDAPPPFLLTYKVPDPVLRYIRLELEPYVKTEPGKAFALVDALWDEPVFELHFLAIRLLGVLPSSEHKPLLKRLQNWVEGNQEDALLEAMATHGLARLRVDEPETLIQQVEKWL